MAVSVARALVAAQIESAWNRLRHESGLAGTRGTLIVMVIAAGVLVLPGGLMFRVGAVVGQTVADPRNRDAVENWNALQAVFTLLFPIAGCFRFSPTLSSSQFGRYPIRPFHLAAAEIPAALFEVFPLLGITGLVMTNVGLATQIPRMAPLIVLLTAANIAGMLALMILLASAWRSLGRWRGAIAVAGIAGILMLFRHGARDFVAMLDTVVPALVEYNPGSYGWRALGAMIDGRVREGVASMAIFLAGTFALIATAAFAHDRAMTRGAWTSSTVRRERPPRRFRGPAIEVAAFFLRQLMASRVGRLQLILPLLFVGPALFIFRAIDFSTAPDTPPMMATIGRTIAHLPFIALALFIAVMMNAQIWMNQFGWDRGSIRALMQLPIEPREILNGKALGLLAFTVAQWIVSLTVILPFYQPSPRELFGGLAASGIAFVITTVIGQFASLHAPRAVPRGGTATLPLYLSWIPSVAMFALVAVLAGIWAIGSAVAAWFAPISLWITLAVVLLAWRAVLPNGQRFFVANREKLLAL